MIKRNKLIYHPALIAQSRQEPAKWLYAIVTGGFTWTFSTQTFVGICFWIPLTQLSAWNHPSLSLSLLFWKYCPSAKCQNSNLSPKMWRYTSTWAWGCFLQKSHVWLRPSLQHPSAWDHRSPPSTAHSTAVLRRMKETEAAYIMTVHFPPAE